MTTFTIPRNPVSLRDRPERPFRSEYFPPAQTFLSLPDPADLPSDRLGREIAIFLHEHPELAQVIGSIDLQTLGTPAKEEILAKIKSALGVRPIRRKDLGYVGP